MKLLSTLLLCLICTNAQAECLKEVFNRFCLGGEANAIDAAEARRNTVKDGQGTIVFTESNTLTMVRIFDGKIESVLRSYKPGNGLKFLDLRTQLVSMYGTPKTMKQMPDYVTDLATMETAIGAKRGRISERWDMQGWGIRLMWWDRDSVNLLYLHEQLGAARRAANPNPQGF